MYMGKTCFYSIPGASTFVRLEWRKKQCPKHTFSDIWGKFTLNESNNRSNRIVGLWWVMKAGVPWRKKSSRSRVENKQTQLSYGAERHTVVGGENSYHCTDLFGSLLSSFIGGFLCCYFVFQLSIFLVLAAKYSGRVCDQPRTDV